MVMHVHSATPSTIEVNDSPQVERRTSKWDVRSLDTSMYNYDSHNRTGLKSILQTFRGRLTEVIDQAQHFAALGPSSGGGSSDDVAQSFREGLEGTERKCERNILMEPCS